MRAEALSSAGSLATKTRGKTRSLAYSPGRALERYPASPLSPANGHCPPGSEAEPPFPSLIGFVRRSCNAVERRGPEPQGPGWHLLAEGFRVVVQTQRTGMILIAIAHISFDLRRFHGPNMCLKYVF